MNGFFEFSRTQTKTLTILAVVVLMGGSYKVIRTYAAQGGDYSRPWQKQALDRYRPPLLLDVNLSPADSLVLAPGIGPALAGRIVEYRRQHGGFLSVDSLVNVKGIGPATLEKMRPYFRTQAP